MWGFAKITMKTKGIKRGQTIELLEQLESVPDGAEVVVEIFNTHPLSQLGLAERQNRIDAVLGAWKDDSEIDAIFAQIDRERHIYQGRQIDLLIATCQSTIPAPSLTNY
jgi:hypothetical protein